MDNGQRRTAAEFSRKLIAWQRRHGRHDLPWQRSRDPYRVWLAEIMLQQTQVATVAPYYRRFLERFPDVSSLAQAPLGEVLRHWAGLGYYSRARNLHRTAIAVLGQHGGDFPAERAALEALHGIGRSTAAAIAVFSFGTREAILDGNVKRVLARYFAVAGYPGEKSVEKRLWLLAESLLPARAIEHYTQALMDLGATVCTRASPGCVQCPVRASCAALGEGRVWAYPASRPGKKLPLRTVAMLLVIRRGKVLLERRPPAGIWGGLWSLPELPAHADVSAHCAAQLGCEVASPSALQPLRHGFTHFTLDILPYRCEVRRLRPRVAEQNRAWFALAEAQDAGVPSPVRKLLGLLLQGSRQRRTLTP